MEESRGVLSPPHDLTFPIGTWRGKGTLQTEPYPQMYALSYMMRVVLTEIIAGDTFYVYVIF